MRHVIRAIKELVELGEFEVFTADDLNARSKTPNHYYIKVECPDTCDMSASHKDLPVWKRLHSGEEVIHMGDRIDTYG